MPDSPGRLQPRRASSQNGTGRGKSLPPRSVANVAHVRSFQQRYNEYVPHETLPSQRTLTLPSYIRIIYVGTGSGDSPPPFSSTRSAPIPLRTDTRVHTCTETKHRITTHSHRCATVGSDARRNPAPPPSKWRQKQSQKNYCHRRNGKTRGLRTWKVLHARAELVSGFLDLQFRKPADAEQESGNCNASRSKEELYPTYIH